MEEYLSELGPEDAVVMEASCGSFYWAHRVEATGATCYILDPMRFRIITDSWNKTDRQDARNMAKALWVFLVTGPGRPCIQAMLTEDGVTVSSNNRSRLFKGTEAVSEILADHHPWHHPADRLRLSR
jgi:hypothetical protein